MASSSSSSVQQKHQVFLSFRGEDTRLNFTSHLRWALERKGIGYFIDDQLKRGEEISPALLTAIQESKISIIVLSKDYASSSWCLEELSKILECKNTNGQIVVPIFYHVDPSDVRNQKGKSFEDAFEKHQERFKNRTDKVLRWRAALKEVGNLSGYPINGQPNDRCESKHIKTIVDDISKKLTDNPSNDFKGLVGIDSRIEEIESMLCFKLVDVQILGIHGMGGIGKTTIAEVIYHRNSARFEGCYFLPNVREKSKYELIRLRNELLCKLLEERNLNVDTGLLSPFIRDRLHSKKVLIVLDDVDDSMQLDLLPEKHYFGPGSRIIITSRDRGVLRRVVDVMYKVEGLIHDEALQLFSMYAFKQSHPKEDDFMKLSEKVVHYANGVPLALRVLGSALYGRSKEDWEGDLNKLKEIPNRGINGILRISFDGLDCEVKDIFLDIACFFKGMDRDYVKDILGGCYISAMSGISVLVDKSVISISHNRVEMHDLLQQMGRDIICRKPKEHGKLIEPGKRSRLWTPEDIYYVMKNNTGTGRVTGMFLDMSKTGELHLRPEAFERMYNLRFLKFYYFEFKRKRTVYLSQQRLDYLPDTLTYLHWDDYPSKSLPSNFRPENLVELCMTNSHVKQLWNGVQNLGNLKRINLNYSQQLIEIPDLSRAINLEIMCFSGCTSLAEFPSSIGYLNNLVYLGLGCCRNGYFLGYLSMSYLMGLHHPLDCCSNITKFPKIPKNVENLCLSGIAIEEVPSSIECLSRLTYLCLRDCRRLKKLPSSICKLKFLRELNLKGCLNLESFPEILETMDHLQYLDLSYTLIEELPSSVENLVRLERLWLKNCEKLKNLPSSIRKLNSLKLLSLTNCSNLTNLNLSATAIEQILSSIECCSKLEDVFLQNCAKLGSLPRYLFNCFKTRRIYISLSKLEVFREHLGTVEEVNICPLYGTAEEVNICPSYGTAETMRSDFRWSKVSLFSNLSLNDLGSLRNSIGDMKSLRHLSVSHSSVFDELPDNLEYLKSLTDLCLSFCDLSVFSSRLTFISSLTKLDLSGNNFETIPASIKQFLKLEELDLSYCKRLRSLPELPPCLRYLDAHDCTSLEAVSYATSYVDEFLSRSCQCDLEFIFKNCVNLDQNAILAKTQLHIQQMATEDVKLYYQGISPMPSLRICFPGSEIPEWFNCQNLGSSVITLQYLDEHNDHKFVGFALCIVVAFDDCRNSNVECRFKLKINGDYCGNFFASIPSFKDPRFVSSDHVFLVYDSVLYHDSVVYHCLDNGESIYHLNEASFEFYLDGHPVHSCTIKKCGVRALYGQVPHPPSESDAGECNPLMIQTSSSSDPTCLSLKCGDNNQDFEEPMVEDGDIIKRCCCYDEAESSGSFNHGRDAIMILPSSPDDRMWLSSNCGVIDQGFGEPMQEDVNINKRSRDDHHNKEAEPSRNFSSEQVEEEPHPKRLKCIKFF